MSTEKITVYSFRRCPFAMRVRLALHEKGIPFEVVEEDLKNFSDQLRSLHPEAKVPVLVHGKTVVYESAIMTEYIDDLAPDDVPLMPRVPAERAEVRLWTYWCNNHFKGDIDRLKYGRSRFPESECAGIEDKVKADLAKLEERLHTSEWLVGEKFSLADIHLFPFCRQLVRIQPQPAFLASYPKLLTWVEKISLRPAFLRTMEK